MKVRIVTYHSVINRGALLQAYGLQLNFKKLFPQADVKLVDRLPLRLFLYELMRALPKNKNGLEKWHRYKLIRNDVKNLFDLDNTDLKVLSSTLSESDVLVSGSDCIWRIDDKLHLPPFPNQYWLPYTTRAKKISFSTSASGSNPKLAESKRVQIHDLVADYTLVAVRDNFTKGIIGRKDAVITPDPSFFVPISESPTYPKVIQNFLNANPGVYGVQIYNNHFPEHVQHYIDSSSDNKVLGLTNNFKTNLNIDHLINTLQWTSVYKELGFHVTDSFHGTIFSIRNKTPFLSLETGKIQRAHSKKYSILLYVGLEDLYVNLNEYQNDVEIIVKKQREVSSNWKSKYVPLIEIGLGKVRKDLENYNESIRELGL